MARAALGGMRSRRSRQGGSIRLLLRLPPLTSSFLSHYSGFADANRATSVPLFFWAYSHAAPASFQCKECTGVNPLVSLQLAAQTRSRLFIRGNALAA